MTRQELVDTLEADANTYSVTDSDGRFTITSTKGMRVVIELDATLLEQTPIGDANALDLLLSLHTLVSIEHGVEIPE